MTHLRRIVVFALELVLAGGLSACSALQTYEKCGAGCPGDAQVTTQVTDALRNRPAIEFWNVNAQCLDGVVYLYGIVDTYLERSVIEQISVDASGGKKVVNSIAVRGNVH
jgi:osmotically-inducible protein OsmY